MIVKNIYILVSEDWLGAVDILTQKYCGVGIKNGIVNQGSRIWVREIQSTWDL